MNDRAEADVARLLDESAECSNSSSTGHSNSPTRYIQSWRHAYPIPNSRDIEALGWNSVQYAVFRVHLYPGGFRRPVECIERCTLDQQFLVHTLPSKIPILGITLSIC